MVALWLAAAGMALLILAAGLLSGSIMGKTVVHEPRDEHPRPFEPLGLMDRDEGNPALGERVVRILELGFAPAE